MKRDCPRSRPPRTKRAGNPWQKYHRMQQGLSEKERMPSASALSYKQIIWPIRARSIQDKSSRYRRYRSYECGSCSLGDDTLQDSLRLLGTKYKHTTELQEQHALVQTGLPVWKLQHERSTACQIVNFKQGLFKKSF